MANEDVVQISDRAFLNVTVVGTTVTVNEKTGPIESVTAPADGKLRVLMLDGGAIPESKQLLEAVYLQNGGGNTPVLQTGAPARTLEVWTYDAAGALTANYEARMTLKRVE